MDTASNQIAPAPAVDSRSAPGVVRTTSSLQMLHQLGRRTPVEGGTVRLCFVGQSTYFKYCALEHSTQAIEPAFVDFRAGSDPELMLAKVEALKPHIVIVFRPELIPTGLFHGLTAVTVGYFTEPVPRPNGPLHPDLESRLHYLRELDPSNFDRLMSFDPMIGDTIADLASLWRSVPLPVADSLYAPVRSHSRHARSLFVGRSTEHRDAFLDPVKHEFDTIHVAHGITEQKLSQFFAECDVAINIHNEPYPSYENRVSLALAAGLLVVSETLSPTHGLEPGIDYIEVILPWELRSVLYNASRYPGLYDRIRIRGRQKAERFRASAVYPRLIADLLLDIGTFGTQRS
jgi:hypothetical protein